MSSPSPESRREHPSTYFVQDRSNMDEMTRVTVQDQMLTKAMGGVLPEQSDVARFQRVLDVGCGTGGWLIEAAKTYPTMTRLVGVDVSERMMVYAREQAKKEQVADRVEFHAMDALRMLEFPANTFDLVNQRLGESYLRTYDWPKLLSEYLRVARPDGVIRITESDLDGQGSSPALKRLGELMLEAFYRAGHLFAQHGKGVTGELERLLSQHGCVDVQTRMVTLEYRAATPEGQLFIEDTTRLYQTIKPFLRKWIRLPDDYDQLYEQALVEMQRPDFFVICDYTTAWGRKPQRSGTSRAHPR